MTFAWPITTGRITPSLRFQHHNEACFGALLFFGVPFPSERPRSRKTTAKRCFQIWLLRGFTRRNAASSPEISLSFVAVQTYQISQTKFVFVIFNHFLRAKVKMTVALAYSDQSISSLIQR